MGAPEQWVIATGNAGKLAEFRRLLVPHAVQPLGAAELGIDAPPETGLTFVENALTKARHAARAAHRPAIADDSGLCVRALDGGPGLRSARFAGPQASDADNIAALLERLGTVRAADRAAWFVCVIVALHGPEDPDPIIATGHWHGRIAAAPRGSHGFGYDPIFEIPALGRTAAELTPEEKSARSHRGQATRRLLEIWSARRSAGS